MIPTFLHLHPDGVCLSVKLVPRASANEISESAGVELKIRVTAPPVDSAANDALLELLTETLGCARGAVQLIRGHTSRHKTVLIRGMTAERLEQLLMGKSNARRATSAE
jgi:uncharacterized protein (TIGR00251 family)